MKKYIVLAVILTVLSASFIKDHQENIQNECADIQYQRTEYFTINDVGVINVEPTIVRISFSIIIEKEQAVEALKVANQIQSQSFQSLQQVDTSNAGITIKKTWFNLQPITRYQMNQIEFKGYQVSAQYQLQTQNLKIAGQLIDTAIKSGVTNINSIVFDIKDEEKAQYEDQALQLAIQNAKNKAEVTLNSLNMKILSIKSINNISNSSNKLEHYAMDGVMGAAAKPTIEMHSTEKTITKNVQLGFVITPKDS